MKNIFKKIIIIALSASLICGFVACGGGSSDCPICGGSGYYEKKDCPGC